MAIAEDRTIEWEAPEFETREKSPLWYWCSIIVAVLLIAFAAWQRNILFGAFVAIAEILVLTLGGRAPETARFQLDHRGLTINDRTEYPWSDLESFSMEPIEGAERHRIALRLKHRFRPTLRIRAPSERVAEVRTLLARRIREVEAEPSIIEALEDLLRF